MGAAAAADLASPPAAPNAAVVSILRDAGGAPVSGSSTAAPPPASKPGLSMHPEAVRARARRAKQSGRPSSTAERPPAPTPSSFAPPPPAADTPRLTPETLRAELSSLPAPAAAATPEQIALAVKNVAKGIQVCGWVAAAIFKSDDMKVPAVDANETATLIVDGWPELATNASGDAKKALAIAAVASLVIERHGKYQRSRGMVREVRPSSAAPEQPAADRGGGTLIHVPSLV